jgi:hypothetical protein
MTIEIVEFPIKKGGSFHSYVKLPEGMSGMSGMSHILTSEAGGVECTHENHEQGHFTS